MASILKEMQGTLLKMLTSKKAIASIAGVVVGAGAHFGLHLDPEVTALFITPIVTYIVAQGWADSGKEAARIQSEQAQGQPQDNPVQINRE